MIQRKLIALVCSIGITCAAGICLDTPGTALAQCFGKQFTTDFMIEECTFLDCGINPYFILQPGYQLFLEGEEDGETVAVLITVLNATKRIDVPGVGTVVTRVVEEREWVDDELAEVSRNFFAICERTNDVFYFGEDVDNYENGVIVNHDGTWRVGINGAMPGIIMPGTFLLGSRYFQEQAPGIAEDLAEHVAMGLTVRTPAGTFKDCVKVKESSALDCSNISIKKYCAGIGLVADDVLKLVDYGYTISTGTE